MVELSNITITAIVALVSGLVGFVPTYLGAILKFRKDLQAEYDKDLRSKRIIAYKILWKRLEPLAKYVPPDEKITYDTLIKLMTNLRMWYFEIGGLFLSPDSRDKYFELMDELKETADKLQIENGNFLTEESRENIRQRGSNLRTSLCKDVGTRQRPVLKDD